MQHLYEALAAASGLRVERDVDLRRYNRFGLGGRAGLLADAADAEALAEAVLTCHEAAAPLYLLGDGSNVIVSDDGFHGLVLRYRAAEIMLRDGQVRAAAGASLESLVDATIGGGLAGLHTLTRIPGTVGGAVYGNAGAYGNSINEVIETVRLFDGRRIREVSNADCEFDYRESVFKRRKDWVILDCTLRMPEGDPETMRSQADEIRAIRDEKFPPSMRCAGSIFKNLYLASLPAAVRDAVPHEVVRGAKVASAYFLEKVGAKGMRRGGIAITDYHANILYNAGGGTAADLRAMAGELKRRVREQFGFELEEEVQYVGGV